MVERRLLVILGHNYGNARTTSVAESQNVKYLLNVTTVYKCTAFD